VACTPSPSTVGLLARLIVAPFPIGLPKFIWTDQFLYKQLSFHMQLIHRPDDGGSGYYNETTQCNIPEGSIFTGIYYRIQQLMAESTTQTKTYSQDISSTKEIIVNNCCWQTSDYK
jgi:hypothetical protein